MRRAAALLAAALAAAPGAASGQAGAGRDAAALCEASVSLDPVRAYPGQQVLYRLRLLVRADVSDASFEEPPSFPGLRAERLVPEPGAGPVLRDGSIHQVRDDARALFADRPGSVAIPPARLLCRSRGAGGEIAQRVATPALTLEIAPLPEAGRPAGFEGLVGPLSLRRIATPESVALGGSVRLVVTLQGAGNLWDAREPELPAQALGGAEVFRRAAELELDRGTHLLVRRRFVFDLVPRREGPLEIPALAVAYYDPVAGRYAEAAAEAVRVSVGPPAASSGAGAERAEPTVGPEARGSPEPAGPSGRRALVVAGAALLLAALGALGRLSWRRRRARTEPARAALARADAARARGDRDGELAELARALRAALAAPSGAADAPPEAVLASHSPRARRAAELLDGLERARFDPKAEAPAREAILRALAELGAGDGRSRSDATRWLPLFLVAAGAVVYWNSLEGAFVNDDRRWILQDPAIRSLGNWRAILSDTPRPLLKLTLALNYAVGGHDVTGYHLVNVAVHLLAGLALYGALRRTPGCPLWLAFASALLWLVHPLQTQAVTYLIQRGESMMGLFYLLTLYGAIRCATGPRPQLWLAVALIACALGLGTKEVMVTAPFMVLLYDRTFHAGSFARALTERRALYLGLAIVWAAVLFGAIGARALFAGEFVRPDLPTVGPVAYALTQPQVILQYLKLVVWPHPLCFDYNWPAATSAAEILPSLLVVTALLGATLYALWRRSWLGFAGAWFFGLLAPTSSVFPIQDLAVEHRMYLALASPLVLLVAGAYRVLAPAGRARPALAGLLLAGVTVSLGAATVSRNRDYRSGLALRGSVVVAVPESARGRYNYGTELKAANRLDEAIRELRLAVELDPRFAEAHYNLANALRATGQVEEAIAHYRLAIAANPHHAGARTNLANALLSQGRVEEALVEYRAAVEANPEDARAQYNLAFVLGEQDDLDGAIEAYRRALALRPRHAPSHNNLGTALRRQGDLAGALAHHREAVRIDPRHAGAQRNLGIDLEARGEREEAIVHYRRALELEPLDPRTRALLEAARNRGTLP